MIQIEPQVHPHGAPSDKNIQPLQTPSVHQRYPQGYVKGPMEGDQHLDESYHSAEARRGTTSSVYHASLSSIYPTHTVQIDDSEIPRPKQSSDALQECNKTSVTSISSTNKRKREEADVQPRSLAIEKLPVPHTENNTGVECSRSEYASDPPESIVEQDEMLLSKGSMPTSTHDPPIPGKKSELGGNLLFKAFREHEQIKAQDAPEDSSMHRSNSRPSVSIRAQSTPFAPRQPQSPRKPNDHHSTSSGHKIVQEDVHLEVPENEAANIEPLEPSPVTVRTPWTPLSIPTYLQLELYSHSFRGHLHRSAENDIPYESSGVKIERLLNFLLLPPHLEGVLCFGALACFDAWLYTFTILPLRLLRSIYILSQSWASKVASEIQYLSIFIYNGTGRVWRRWSTRGASASHPDSKSHPYGPSQLVGGFSAASMTRHHRRTRSAPSTLLQNDKADMLRGLLIICTCLILHRLDASRMYHWIRGQAAIKLYVIYNVLEVCDRLFSAIGQDVLECLFSREALERKPNGHSKILRPLWLFTIALVYTTVHATALFYQVITLNVAVNSYSNALITLLLSNQFVEIKSTVFKRFEKENLFQLTCADVVERFQLWLMLTIIAARNIVETGGLSVGGHALYPPNQPVPASFVVAGNNATQVEQPLFTSAVLPRSYTLIPNLLSSLKLYVPAMDQVFGPFLAVLGSEMLVDWLKHAYINKFNNVRPTIYGRFLDVLTKDYYSHAFTEQNLTKRLGLPVIPLSCLFIRASVQTYHMFVAAWVPVHKTSSSPTLASIHEQYTASRETMPMSTVAVLSHKLNELTRQIPEVVTTSRVFANFTTVLAVVLVFLVLLALKIVLGMLLLAFSRSRYMSMNQRGKHRGHQIDGCKRVGGWGVVEVDEPKRQWIYEDDPAALRSFREREQKAKVKASANESFEKINRYEMAAKRIW